MPGSFISLRVTPLSNILVNPYWNPTPRSIDLWAKRRLPRQIKANKKMVFFIIVLYTSYEEKPLNRKKVT
jgi:hypothetical protein